jgi:hypothetical protein
LKALSITAVNVLSMSKGISKILSITMQNILNLTKQVVGIIYKVLAVISINALSLSKSMGKSFAVSTVNLVYLNKKFFVELSVVIINLISIIAEFIKRTLGKGRIIVRAVKKGAELTGRESVLKKDNTQKISSKDKTVKLTEKRGEL